MSWLEQIFSFDPFPKGYDIYAFRGCGHHFIAVDRESGKVLKKVGMKWEEIKPVKQGEK